MDLIEGSETSANINQPLGIHPKIETVNTEHSESLKSRTTKLVITKLGIAMKSTPIIELGCGRLNIYVCY
jgi:hypothetical protein